MIHVGVCDDNAVILRKYSELLKKIANEEKVDITIHTFESGEALLFETADEVNALDIIYLDILMGNINGIETAKELRKRDCDSEIIYLTSSEEYVFESFDTQPLHYIIKDSMDEAKFKEIFMRAIEKKQNRNTDVFICEAGAIMKKINISDIYYFEIINRIVTVHYKGGSFEFYASMDNVEQRLIGKGFVRTHRSFLVHMLFIDRVMKNTILLNNQEELPIGHTYLKTMKKAFSDYLIEEM